jgi:hypothetical protein
LVFAAITLVSLFATMFAGMHHRHRDLLTVIVCSALAATEMAVMMLVIDHTWRRTVLVLGAGRLRLTFVALLRKRQYAWPIDAVEDVRIIRTQDVPDGAPLAEVEIHFADQPVVKLFTDHLDRTLQPVAQMIRFGLGHSAAAPAMPLDSPEPLSVPPPDEKTFDRLVNVHRAMRSREVKR